MFLPSSQGKTGGCKSSIVQYQIYDYHHLTSTMSGSDNLEPLSPSLQKIILRDSGSRRTLYLLSRRSALLGWDLLQVRRLEAG